MPVTPVHSPVAINRNAWSQSIGIGGRNHPVRADTVERDTAFDNKDFFSGGIRLFYNSTTETVDDLKEGVLLEVGFDDVTPNEAKDISSWAYDYATGKIDIIDNRAKGVASYDPRYTFVEKLQTISTKFRLQHKSGESPVGFMRHYYDVYSLLQRHDVQEFIGADAYKAHKEKRFRGADNPNIAQNEAFTLNDPKTRKTYADAFAASGALYYGDKRLASRKVRMRFQTRATVYVPRCVRGVQSAATYFCLWADA